MITVQFPDSVLPNFFPYWSKDNQTGQLTGYYVDYLAAVLKEAGIQNYTFRSQNRYGASYISLGRFCLICPLSFLYPYLISLSPIPYLTCTLPPVTCPSPIFYLWRILQKLGHLKFCDCFFWPKNGQVP